MTWILFVCLVWALNMFCNGQLSMKEDYRLSQSGYHLCKRNETRIVSYTVQYLVPYTVTQQCGGWIPWKTCQVTKYRPTQLTEYKTVTKQVIRCCEGYTQIGHYCALTEDRSREISAKPGSCPSADGLYGSKGCEWDMDCLGWQKCCQTSSCFDCADPTSSNSFDPGLPQFNATVTIKVDYQELMSREGGLHNHTRLLYAMVIGALESNVSIRYLSSQPVHPYRTATSLMIRCKLSPSLNNVTSMLHRLLKHVQEVSSVTVEDIDECALHFLHRCSPHAVCVNTFGLYYCTCRPGYTDVDSTNPGTHCTALSTLPPEITCFPPMNTTTLSDMTCAPTVPYTSETSTSSTTCPLPRITDLRAANVTSTSFRIYWSSQFPGNQSYRVVLSKGAEVIVLNDTSHTMVEMSGLQAGVLYEVTVTPYACGRQGSGLQLTIKMDAQTLDATARLTNVNYTSDLQNASSTSYLNLTASIYMEIYRSLSPEMRALVDAGRVRIEITGFAPGSVVVSFTLVFILTQGEDINNVSVALINSLMNSSKYDVDANKTEINDRDECTSGENDCSLSATCANTRGSYTCACSAGFVDGNPERPGRSCQAKTLGATVSQTTMFNPTIQQTTVTSESTTQTVMPTTATTTATATVAAPTMTTAAPTTTAPTTTTISAPSTTTTNTPTTTASLTTTTTESLTSTTASLTTTTAALTTIAASLTTIPASPTTTTAFLTTTPASSTTTPASPTTTTASLTTTPAPPTTTTASPTTTTASLTTTPASSTIMPASLTTAPAPPTTFTASPTTTTASLTTTSASSTIMPASLTTTTAPPTTTTASLTTTPASSTIMPASLTTAPAPPTTFTASPTTTTASLTTTSASSTIMPASLTTTPILPTTTTASPTTTTAFLTNTSAFSTIMPASLTTTPTPPTTTTASPTASLTTTSASLTTTPASPTTTAAISTTTPASLTTTPAPPTTTTASPTTSLTTTAASLTTTGVSLTTSTASSTTTTASTTIPPLTIKTVTTTTATAAMATTIASPTSFATAVSTTLIATAASSTTKTQPGTTTTSRQTLPFGVKTINISASEAIAVKCNLASITVTVARDFLQRSYITEAALHLGMAECGVNGGNATHAELTVAWDDCNTLLKHVNDSYYTVSVTLFNSINSSNKIQAPKIKLEIPVICTYNKSSVITSDFGSMGYDTIKDVIAGSGMFQVSVQLMNGTVPLPHNFSLAPSESVMVVVSLNTSVDKIKVVINKCWATPTANPSLLSRYIFMENRCSINPFTTVITNGNSSSSSLSVQIFSFVDLSIIYLHCQVEICVELDSASCAPDCLQRTSRSGSGSTVGRALATSGPLFLLEDDPFEEGYDTASVIGLSCLGVGLTIFFIIGFVCLFYYQRNRIGHYNFNNNNRPKEENFTVLTLSA